MKKRRVRFRLRVKPRFFAVLALLLVMILTPILFFALRENEYAIISGSASETIRVQGVIIRRESVVAAQQTGQINLMCAENDLVSKNDQVLAVYSAQYSSDTLVRLNALRDDILAYQRSDILDDILDADLNALDTQIAQKTDLAAQSAREGDAVQMRLLHAQLDDLLSQRQDYLRRNYRVDEKLTAMLEEEEKLTAQLEDWTTIVKAPFAGRVSFSFDGCEHVLNADALENLTASSLASAVSQGNMQRITQATQYTSLFRIADTNGWYCVVPLDDDYEMAAGQKYTLTISGIRYDAMMLENEVFAENGLIVLYVEGDPSAVLNARSVDVTIDKSFSGLMVPERALKRVDGQIGVYVLSGGGEVFCPVQVLARQGDFAVILSAELAIGYRIALH